MAPIKIVLYHRDEKAGAFCADTAGQERKVEDCVHDPASFRIMQNVGCDHECDFFAFKQINRFFKRCGINAVFIGNLRGINGIQRFYQTLKALCIAAGKVGIMGLGI